MKKLALGLLIASGLLLTGCAETASEPANTKAAALYESVVTLSDGRKVLCVTYESGRNAGGVSCDWDSAK